MQKLFSIPTDNLLLVFLHYSKALREFCGFTKVPDAAKITRFKQDFLPDLQDVFDRMVDITEPICQSVDSVKADMTIFDSSGIEAWVRENNPKYADRIIRQVKAYAKAMKFDNSYEPHKVAYGMMPSSAEANHEIKQLYISKMNGRCYRSTSQIKPLPYRNGIIASSIRGLVNDPEGERKKIYPCMPQEVLDAIIMSIDLCTAIGKRDYAILLLAASSGMRAGDIATKKFQILTGEKASFI